MIKYLKAVAIINALSLIKLYTLPVKDICAAGDQLAQDPFAMHRVLYRWMYDLHPESAHVLFQTGVRINEKTLVLLEKIKQFVTSEHYQAFMSGFATGSAAAASIFADISNGK